MFFSLVTEDEFLTLAENLRLDTEEAMKIEVAPWIQEYVTDMDDLYTDLTLEKLNDKACGQLREELKNYQELFPVQKPETVDCRQHKGPGKLRKRGRKILFKGEPGMGKSTLVKKVAWDWAKGIFTAVSVVFFVFLKLVNPGDAIENVIIDQTPVLEGIKVTPGKLRDILETHGPRCLLILDGLDEHALGQNQDVIKIMKGQKYLYCNVIVTSRPHSTQDYQKYFSSIVSVEGFTKNEARKFASRIVQDDKKVEDILRFNPHGENNPMSLHNVPILLSFLCVLVREDQIDLTSTEMPIGEIYFRMVRCLYKKFTLRKGIEYQDSQFVEMLKSLAKLALNGKALLKRSDVLREVGPDAFNYGLLIGHEDFRLVRDETADIFVSFPHRTILEFLWSFCFIVLLNEGKSVDYLLDSYHVLTRLGTRYVALLDNPLFLNFSLWFLSTDEMTFSFLARDKIRDALIRFVVGQIDKKYLNLPKVCAQYPIFNLKAAERDRNKIFLTFLKDVLAQCGHTEYLAIGLYDPVDWVLTAMNERFNSFKEIRIQTTLVHDLSDSTGRLESERLRAELDVWKICPEVDFNICFNRFEEIEEFNVLMRHCTNAKRKPCVHLHSHVKSLELSEILRTEMAGLHVSRFAGKLVCNREIPLCLSLRHLAIMGLEVKEALLSVLSRAIQNSRLPNLSHLSLRYSSFETSRFLPVLFQSECTSVQYLNLYGCKLSIGDLELLGSVGHAEKSFLPSLSSLLLSAPSFASNETPMATIFSRPWNNLTCFTLGNLDLPICTELVKMLNERKLPNLKELRLSAYCEVVDIQDGHGYFFGVVEPGINVNNLQADELPHLESLTLLRMINSEEELETLGKKIMTWKLQKLDISHSRHIRGSLSILLGDSLLFLNNLVLQNCGLSPDDLGSIARAKARGKLPAIQHLDVSFNDKCNLSHDPDTSESVSWENVRVKT